ncbi:hypothetical protein AT05_11665 [Schleiferia thermophila str. Yellowstone]|uniref:hypothetical protein n=1 Tax=Schleiferia thermophila TaxID=884107 RepID=UPI0004E6DB48|nr:hypothetical protein [Schleiferia thermophila]KFD38127.1 hypothetical protein AT05_11665 [Schleiferia thermophila str. Yellowstone]
MKKIFALSVLLLLSAACSVEDPVYNFRIRVVNEARQPIDSAFVFVAPNVPNSIVQFSGYTNRAGEVTFTYDKEAIFIVEAKRGLDSITMLLGCGYIKLSPQQEAFVQIVATPTNDPDDGCF